MADMMYAAVKALIERNGNYLFLSIDVGEETIWVPPGGRLEYGESSTEALKREVKGETSLEIEPGDPIGMYHFFTGPEDQGEQVALTLFEVKSFDGELDMDTKHVEEDGLKDYRWMSPEEIRSENVTDTLRSLLEEKVF